MASLNLTPANAKDRAMGCPKGRKTRQSQESPWSRAVSIAPRAPHLSVSIVKNQDGRGRASCERCALARTLRRRGLKSARCVRRKAAHALIFLISPQRVATDPKIGYYLGYRDGYEEGSETLAVNSILRHGSPPSALEF